MSPKVDPMTAGMTVWLFWVSLATSLSIAGAAAFPVNRWLIARGTGHALVPLVRAYH